MNMPRAADYQNLSDYTAAMKAYNQSFIKSNPAKTTAYIPKSSSAKTVSNDTVLTESPFGEYDNLIQMVKGVSEANTARSADFAAEQRDWQAGQNKIAMDFNAAEAAKNRDWQQYMSNTAHQREVADLQAAGLNPILSATGGQGAYVGSGATASGVTSSGAKGEVDTGFEVALLNFLSNIMGYATSTASAGINAGAVVGSANIAAQSAQLLQEQSQRYGSSHPDSWPSLLTGMMDAIYGSNTGLRDFGEDVVKFVKNSAEKKPWYQRLKDNWSNGWSVAGKQQKH